MGLIGDRKSKKQKEKEKEIEKLRNAQNLAKSALVMPTGSPLKKKGVGGMVGPLAGGGLMRYPAGYYTTPAPSSSAVQMWGGGPRHLHGGPQPHHPASLLVNPRYQTWVAPRKQPPHLNQLVSRCGIGIVERTRSARGHSIKIF
jgi:hypothetical protein